MFADRTDAGEQLADRLEQRGVETDVVLAVPRGGLPLGRVVADRLDAPLDVVVAKKMGAPHNPELAIGAVGADGSAWVNDAIVARVGADDEYVEAERERKAEQAREKADLYREGKPVPELEGQRVLVVDDGVATGATTIACLRQVENAGAAHVVLAVPVGSPDSIERLRDEADEVICVDTPPGFGAVGQFYRRFDQVSDDEARSYLDR
ncbi:phosphoribosyltransferase [Halomicrococcus gelatinilyticus]|uniref:phosphoribosyltransferase n=1 Tax=Halomicrococcus gelatinilyticus TaxID=1702103 RepID=UPI002E0D3F61